MTSLARAFVHGVPVDWSGTHPAAGGSTCRPTPSRAVATGSSRHPARRRHGPPRRR
ncbi:hypothetical protein NKH77_00800 [Streptomyces sp. M19]